MSPTTIAVEPFEERHWLQVSYLLDALGETKTDKGDSLPAGTIRRFRSAEKDGTIIYNVVIPKNFRSSWFLTLGIDRPDCSLRAGPEESGDPECHVLKLAIDQFPEEMRAHLDFFRTVENSIGLVDTGDGGSAPRAFLGYGLHSVVVRGNDYVFSVPADITVRPFAAFIGIDRRQIVREAVNDEEGNPVCDTREVPLHRFAIPIVAIRAHFAAQTVDGQKTVTFTLPKKQ